MRTENKPIGWMLLALAASLAGSVLYDATDLTLLLGLDPGGNEASVALAGLGAAALLLGFGIRCVRRASPPHLEADAR